MAFHVFRNNKKFSLVPWFLEWLKGKTEQLCSKVVGQECKLGNFTAKRIKANDTNATSMLTETSLPLYLMDLEGIHENMRKLEAFEERFAELPQDDQTDGKHSGIDLQQ